MEEDSGGDLVKPDGFAHRIHVGRSSNVGVVGASWHSTRIRTPVGHVLLLEQSELGACTGIELGPC